MTDNPLSSLPEGLGMALAQNMSAMRSFSSLSADGRQAVIDRARSVRSSAEMRSLVNELAGSR